jgi:hypothetical protein
MLVLEQPLNTRHRPGGLGGWDRDLVDDHGFSVFEDGLPALARARIDEFISLGLGSLSGIWGPW